MKLPFVAAALMGLASLPSHAVLVNSVAGLAAPVSVIDFESYDGLLTSGPEAVAPQVIFTGDTGSELGATIRDLNDNGAWGVGNRFAASGFVGELRFTFSDVTSGAGAFVNHYAFDPLPFSIVVSAYGNNNQIIETHSITVNTAFDSYNDGVFLGISRPGTDIRSLSFKGVGIVLDNFSFTSPVPEPGTWLMMVLGGVGLAGWKLRHKRAAA